MAAAFPINFFERLKEIFPHKPNQQITEVIQIVEDEGVSFHNDQEKFETMFQMLFGNGDIENEENEIEGAVGYQRQVNLTGLSSHYDELTTIFPDASTDYLWQLCLKKGDSFDFDEVCDELRENGYEKTEADPLTIWEYLREALPNADPSYLRTEAEKIARENSTFNELIEDFLNNATEKNDYPKMKDYIVKKKEEKNLNMFNEENFNIDNFLKIFPNPEETFRNPERKLPLNNDNTSEEDEKFALTFLYNHYCYIRKRHIDKVFKWKEKNLIEICDKLDKLKKGMRKPRMMEDEGKTKNLPLMQEIAYLKHRKAIRRIKKYRDDSYIKHKEEARKFGLLVSCQCCLEDELIPEECYFCTKDCIFCKECVLSGSEQVIGRAESKFPCFNNCEGQFSLSTLQMVLPEKTFTRLFQRIQSEELKQANLEGLEICPYCDFVKMIDENQKVFQCENPDCMVESCRQCKHESHIPLRCNEIEYDEDVKRRTYIENKMTEALTRTCYSCKKTFVKENGCNKMTCGCGAKMCYLCGAAIMDYSHFRDGGRCALFTNDVQVNYSRVLEGANLAKQELGNVEIKFDPADNLEQFFT